MSITLLHFVLEPRRQRLVALRMAKDIFVLTQSITSLYGISSTCQQCCLPGNSQTSFASRPRIRNTFFLNRNVHAQVLIYKGCLVNIALACCLCNVMANLWYNWFMTHDFAWPVRPEILFMHKSGKNWSALQPPSLHQMFLLSWV